MSRGSRIKGTDAVVDCLRRLAQHSTDGALLGSEKALMSEIGTSRTTLRQAARLVEREGLLKVRRGIHGGYFATRTGVPAIEYAVGACLETLEINPQDLGAIASSLWVEVLRKAAGVQTEDAQAFSAYFRRKLNELRPNISLQEIVDFEQDFRKAIFGLINAPYIEFIFNINAAYAYKAFHFPPRGREDTDRHHEFVRAWRRAKQVEQEAIAAGDQSLAMMAARASRLAWRKRIWE